MGSRIEKLSTLVPNFNGANKISRILDRITAVELIDSVPKEITVVNDCSSDSSKDVILQYIDNHQETDIKYFKHPINRVKESMLRAKRLTPRTDSGHCTA